MVVRTTESACCDADGQRGPAAVSLIRPHFAPQLAIWVAAPASVLAFRDVPAP